MGYPHGGARKPGHDGAAVARPQVEDDVEALAPQLADERGLRGDLRKDSPFDGGNVEKPVNIRVRNEQIPEAASRQDGNLHRREGLAEGADGGLRPDHIPDVPELDQEHLSHLAEIDGFPLMNMLWSFRLSSVRLSRHLKADSLQSTADSKKGQQTVGSVGCWLLAVAC